MNRQGMVIGLWILAGLNTALMLNAFLTYLQLTDFNAFYDSVADYWRMGSLYQPHHYINLNPPHVSVLLFTPLLAFDLRTAAILWTLLSAGLVVLALWLLQSEWKLSRERCELVVGVFAASIALNHCWREGQVGAVLLLLSSLTWIALRRERASAPAWLALSASLKRWIVLSLVGMRRNVAIVAAGIGLLGLLLGVLFCGIDNWMSWWTEINATKYNWFRGSLNISLHGLIARSVSINGEARQSVVIPAWIVLSLVLCAVTWLRQGTEVTRGWLLWLLVGILISPVSWTYYLLVLTGPLVAWGETRGWPRLALTGIGLLVVPPWIVSAFPVQGWSIYGVGTFLVWWSVLTSSPLSRRGGS